MSNYVATGEFGVEQMHEERSMLTSRLSLLALVIIIGSVRTAFAAERPTANESEQSSLKSTASVSEPLWPQPARAPGGAPNIVVILLDDVGFAASSAFGGPVRMPFMEELASHGLRYNRFHVAALCSSTRASLLSGRNEHRVGFGTIVDAARGYPGYDGVWKKSTTSVAEVLRRSGYSTAAFGKWHNTPFSEITPVGPFDRWPTGLGFEYFYGFMTGADSQWEPVLYRNTTFVPPPKTSMEGYHFTTDIVNEAIAWIHSHDSIAPDKPYFLYFATGATHDPLHVPKAWIEKYRGQFDKGWDKLRRSIFLRQKQLGIIPRDTVLTVRPDELPAWTSLSAEQKKIYSRQMEVYAAFLEHTDQEIGRLLRVLGEGKNRDNTLVLYIAGDNGAAALGGVDGLDIPLPLHDRLNLLDGIGSVEYWNLYSAGWAWAMSSPFKWWKTFASHFGGTRSPLIVSWPARIKDQGGLRSQFTHVNDVAATLYEIAKIKIPENVDGIKQVPLDGVSFAYTFDDSVSPSRHRMQVFEQLGNRAIYQDGWIAAARHTFPLLREENKADFNFDRWELYNIDNDFSQADDLANEYPEKLDRLKARFEREAQAGNIFPLGWWRTWMAEPSLIEGRRSFTYWADQSPIQVEGVSIPNFNESHRIVADVQVPQEGAEGILLSVGGRLNGFVLYVKDDRLIYERGGVGLHEVIVSSRTLPRGKVELVYEFRLIDRQDVAGNRAGIGRLYIDRQPVGESWTTGFVPFRGTLDVGRGRVSPVSGAFVLPFKFTGVIGRVNIELLSGEATSSSGIDASCSSRGKCD